MPELRRGSRASASTPVSGFVDVTNELAAALASESAVSSSRSDLNANDSPRPPPRGSISGATPRRRASPASRRSRTAAPHRRHRSAPVTIALMLAAVAAGGAGVSVGAAGRWSARQGVAPSRRRRGCRSVRRGVGRRVASRPSRRSRRWPARGVEQLGRWRDLFSGAKKLLPRVVSAGMEERRWTRELQSAVAVFVRQQGVS